MTSSGNVSFSRDLLASAHLGHQVRKIPPLRRVLSERSFLTRHSSDLVGSLVDMAFCEELSNISDQRMAIMFEALFLGHAHCVKFCCLRDLAGTSSAIARLRVPWQRWLQQAINLSENRTYRTAMPATLAVQEWLRDSDLPAAVLIRLQ